LPRLRVKLSKKQQNVYKSIDNLIYDVCLQSHPLKPRPLVSEGKNYNYSITHYSFNIAVSIFRSMLYTLQVSE